MSEERLLQAEEKLAYQEHGLDRLSEVVNQQQRRIEVLEASVQRLAQRLEALADEWRTGDSPPETERPPHY